MHNISSFSGNIFLENYLPKRTPSILKAVLYSYHLSRFTFEIENVKYFSNRRISPSLFFLDAVAQLTTESGNPYKFPWYSTFCTTSNKVDVSGINVIMGCASSPTIETKRTTLLQLRRYFQSDIAYSLARLVAKSGINRFVVELPPHQNRLGFCDCNGLGRKKPTSLICSLRLPRMLKLALRILKAGCIKPLKGKSGKFSCVGCPVAKNLEFSVGGRKSWSRSSGNTASLIMS